MLFNLSRNKAKLNKHAYCQLKFGQCWLRDKSPTPNLSSLSLRPCLVPPTVALSREQHINVPSRPAERSSLPSGSETSSVSRHVRALRGTDGGKTSQSCAEPDHLGQSSTTA